MTCSAVLLCGYAQVQAADAVMTWSRINNYFYRDGGEFTLASNGVDPFLSNISYVDSAGGFAGTRNVAGTVDSFQTFCLESNERTGSPLTITVSETFIDGTPGSHALDGGVPGVGDDLDPRTAYLYYQFVKGVLTNYNYEPGDATREVTAKLLQNTLWYIEEELSDTEVYLDQQGNPLTPAEIAIIDAWLAEAAAAVADDQVWGNTIGPVRVLNMIGLNSSGTEVMRQDMLYVIDTCEVVIKGNVFCEKAGVITPIPNATVIITDENNVEIAMLVTDADGNYMHELADSDAGRPFTVTVTPPDTYESCDQIVSKVVTPTCDEAGEADFCVCPPEEECEEKICIKVICDANGQQKPVPGTVVALWNKCFNGWGKTGDDGIKCFDGDKLKPGKYWVYIKPPCGYTYSGPCYKEIELAECEQKEIVFIACPKAPCEQSVTVNVIKKNADGTESPGNDLKVKLYSSMTGSIYKNTDDDGTADFTGSNIKSGNYKVCLTLPPGYRIIGRSSSCVEFYLSKCEKKQITICIEEDCDESVCVKVVDKDGKAVKNVTVTVYRSCFEKCGKTNDYGKVCFEDGIKAGEYMVKISVPSGYETCDGKTSKKITISECGHPEVEFCLKKKSSSHNSCNDSHKSKWGYHW